MRILFPTLILLLANAFVANAQLFEPDTTLREAYRVMVHKQDKGRKANGVLWEAKEQEISLVSRQQYWQWKKAAVDAEELRLQKVPADNLKRLRFFHLPNRKKNFMIGAIIGVAVGLPLGAIRQNNYDEDYCENEEDPVWVRCIGGNNRVFNSIIGFGALGGFLGATSGDSFRISFNLKNGVDDYRKQRQRIKHFSVMK
ncbi:MAG: hypothetical protein AAFZ15_10765 [Bacteroidota bacterium]